MCAYPWLTSKVGDISIHSFAVVYLGLAGELHEETNTFPPFCTLSKSIEPPKPTRLTCEGVPAGTLKFAAPFATVSYVLIVLLAPRYCPSPSKCACTSRRSAARFGDTPEPA